MSSQAVGPHQRTNRNSRSKIRPSGSGVKNRAEIVVYAPSTQTILASYPTSGIFAWGAIPAWADVSAKNGHYYVGYNEGFPGTPINVLDVDLNTGAMTVTPLGITGNLAVFSLDVL